MMGRHEKHPPPPRDGHVARAPRHDMNEQVEWMGREAEITEKQVVGRAHPTIHPDTTIRITEIVINLKLVQHGSSTAV
jgi:hypothetical protein